MNKQKMIAFIGGEIISVGADNIMKICEAMLIKDDKIAFVGTREDLDKIISDQDVDYINLQGKSILPGFTDSHLHASSMTELVFDTDMLIGQPGVMFSRQEAIKQYRERIKESIQKTPNASIYRGAGWDPGIFMASKEGLPTKDDLKGIADDKPIILRSYDHHLMWINDKALEMSGITGMTKDPRNGTIYRDKKGNPTGVFQENTAMDLVIEKIPEAEYTVEEYKKGIKEYQRIYGNALGHTMIFDAYNSENGMEAYYQLARDGELSLRVKTCFYANPAKGKKQFDEIIAQKDKWHVNDIFNVDAVKFFVDGSGTTFCMKKPFEAEWLKMYGLPEGYRGYAQWRQEELNEIFYMLNEEGFQIHVHCMGDEATTITLNAFEYAMTKGKVKGLRHTIAHLMQVDENDICRMGKLGIVASMQPIWAQYASLADKMSSKMLGMDRVLDEYRIGSIIKAGSVVSFGTDFPVTIPPSPIIGMQVAMSRSVTCDQPDYDTYRETKLGPVDNPSRDCISLSEAIGAYCYGGAYQCFMEHITGTLEEGKSADFVILNKSIIHVPNNEIQSMHVETTFFRGKEVWNNK